jgi:VIT1/CCC1 family predicted Fe2+/Mn2+ transporter
MNHPQKTGFSFGLTSGIITTLGLMVGLHSSTHSKLAVIGGILIIAIADAFSDAVGIHLSEESENKHSEKQIWQSTMFTFIAKFVFALTFVIPVLLFKLSTAVIVSSIYGLLLLGIFSFYISNKKKENRWKGVMEHVLIALIVIILTHYIGDWIGSRFV